MAVHLYMSYMQDKPRFILTAAEHGLTEVTKTLLVLDGELVKAHDKVNALHNQNYRCDPCMFLLL